MRVASDVDGVRAQVISGLVEAVKHVPKTVYQGLLAKIYKRKK